VKDFRHKKVVDFNEERQKFEVRCEIAKLMVTSTSLWEKDVLWDDFVP